VLPPLSDEDLGTRQEALRAEAAELLADSALAAILADAGPAVLQGGIRTPDEFAEWLSAGRAEEGPAAFVGPA
jgi:hypothetical protein